MSEQSWRLGALISSALLSTFALSGLMRHQQSRGHDKDLGADIQAEVRRLVGEPVFSNQALLVGLSKVSKPGGGERQQLVVVDIRRKLVVFRYMPTDGDTLAAAQYSGSNGQDFGDIDWFDWDGDGQIDMRFDPGRRYGESVSPLSIFKGGEWIRARALDANDLSTVVVGSSRFKFDVNRGAWVPE